MRVLVVDDSVVVRRLVADVLSESGLEIAAALASGDAALVWIQDTANTCDAVVLDVEMPGISGLECVARLRELGITTPVVMFSTVTDTAKGQAAAKAAGADASVRKPANVGSVLATKRALAEELVPTLERIATRRAPHKPARASSMLDNARQQPRPVNSSSTPTPLGGRRALRPQVVVIGSSTGGPDALAKVFSSLHTDIGTPIVIAQHMPESFTKLLAERLTRVSKRQVDLAENGMPLQAGRVVMAPGGAHLSLKKDGGLVRCRLSVTPDVGIYPSADILFSSAVEIWNEAVMGVVLTGMGSDGLAGSHAIHRAGGVVLAQDEASCVVWGMPRAVTEAGIASVLPLANIAEAINQRVKSPS